MDHEEKTIIPPNKFIGFFLEGQKANQKIL
jgi:hypothetical protein